MKQKDFYADQIIIYYIIACFVNQFDYRISVFVFGPICLGAVVDLGND